MWVELLLKAKKEDLTVLIPWRGSEEYHQALAIIEKANWGKVISEQSLEQWAKLLEGARGVIGVDTGLTHLATGLNKPTLCLFGPTNPLLTSTKGINTKTLWLDLPCSPCMKTTCFRPDGQVCFSWMNINEVWENFIEICN